MLTSLFELITKKEYVVEYRLGFGAILISKKEVKKAPEYYLKTINIPINYTIPLSDKPNLKDMLILEQKLTESLNKSKPDKDTLEIMDKSFEHMMLYSSLSEEALDASVEKLTELSEAIIQNIQKEHSNSHSYLEYQIKEELGFNILDTNKLKFKLTNLATFGLYEKKSLEEIDTWAMFSLSWKLLEKLTLDTTDALYKLADSYDLQGSSISTKRIRYSAQAYEKIHSIASQSNMRTENLLQRKLKEYSYLTNSEDFGKKIKHKQDTIFSYAFNTD